MKNTTILQTLLVLGMVLTVVSCAYDEVLPYTPDPGEEVFFAQDIVPILNSSCNGAGCHNGSGPPPDLRAANAYDALWTGGYINIEVPAESDLYLWMNDVKGPMPPLGTNATDNATVLQWITLGALNN